ncbi:RES family NAD+ phosphorylase [Lysinibacillus agricola]|uniref:RES family NAD+ phosphorylase n=1 Tax=Lysinibacillus agricola TaxID=2590012 RepID=A0ABX7ALC5_9BACI|nr:MULTISPECIES: RES family NAD+ phosphorylase [Lysinibacillus]KOS64642.1 hypothetical protein AN161_01055 [Lysinibacillus sp. FJAT-14222]QQP10439.1 RES family NAD+ phosphorylase [Lysinibacillus agricola]
MTSNNEIKIDLPEKYKPKSSGISQMNFDLYIATDDDVIKKWEEFKKEFLKNRFFIPNDNSFVQIYMDSIVKDEALTISKGEKYYRARIRKNRKSFEDKDLNIPPEGITNAGRLNPKFIPYLYISNDETTVVSEVRPHLDANVVISTCEAMEDLKILDLTRMDNDDSKSNNFRKMISLLFSTPYAPDDTELEYIPTQYITELIKNKGFDGVKYRSAMNFGGENICIFSASNFDISITKEIKITGIKYDFDEKTLNED